MLRLEDSDVLGDRPLVQDRFADLDEQPVTQHVPLFEAEHARLQRELGTIDQL